MSKYSAIPQKLRDMPNWVVWGARGLDGKPTKTPVDAKTGRNAKADDPHTWCTFERAVSVADPLNGEDYQGIGFEFGGTSYSPIDGDEVVNSRGEIDPYFLAILGLLGNPYTEKSPSGRGLHAIVECESLPDGGRKMSQDHAGIEIYHGKEKGRYFTITGDHILGEGIPKIEDMSLPYLLITQNKDKKFKAAWVGDTSPWKGDDSAADFFLLCRLAVLTQNDPAKMDRYFSVSKLGHRDKWNRKDYKDASIQKAIATNKISNLVAAPTKITFHTSALPDPDGEYVVAPAERQEDGWFPLGDISLIGGASGTGKTTWIFEMLHKQKQGYPVLEHRTFSAYFFKFSRMIEDGMLSLAQCVD